jgi:hypothetical protein
MRTAFDFQIQGERVPLQDIRIADATGSLPAIDFPPLVESEPISKSQKTESSVLLPARQVANATARTELFVSLGDM